MKGNIKHPPKWADKLLEWYCADEYLEEIKGDLLEAFHPRCNERGLFQARLLFIVIIRSFTIRTFDKSILQPSNTSAMFKYISPSPSETF
jgi:hypothetical protein